MKICGEIQSTHVAKVTNFTPNFVDFVGENDCQISVFSPFHQIFLVLFQ
jgi:hypothetical protein